MTRGPEEHVSRALWARGLKRAFDVAVSAALAVPALPVIAVSAVAVKLESPGPVFFRQERTGRHGRPFRPLKLRTMAATHRHDATEAMPLDHPGVTRVGRVLRRLKIDELPQVFDVLRGEMSIVGPRPTIPEQTREYDEFARRRLLVRPGVTGLAQVNGNAAIPWSERIKYDVHYVANHGLRMDLGILAKTVAVVVLGEERFGRDFEDSGYAPGETR